MAVTVFVCEKCREKISRFFFLSSCTNIKRKANEVSSRRAKVRGSKKESVASQPASSIEKYFVLLLLLLSGAAAATAVSTGLPIGGKTKMAATHRAQNSDTFFLDCTYFFHNVLFNNLHLKYVFFYFTDTLFAIALLKCAL